MPRAAYALVTVWGVHYSGVTAHTKGEKCLWSVTFPFAKVSLSFHLGDFGKYMGLEFHWPV